MNTCENPQERTRDSSLERVEVGIEPVGEIITLEDMVVGEEKVRVGLMREYGKMDYNVVLQGFLNL